LSHLDNKILTEYSVRRKRTSECPLFSGEVEEYDNWKNRTIDWLEIYEEEIRFPAIEMRISLKGKAYEAVKNIDREELKKKNGTKMLLKRLDELYKKDSKMEKLNKAAAFFRIEKKESERMKEYIMRYERTSLECEAVGGGKMSDEMKASHLITGAKLNTSDLHIVLGACGRDEYNFESVKLILGNVFQNAETRKSDAKEEAWVAERWEKNTQKIWKCFKCQEEGHIAKNCPKKGNKCFICKKEGHLANNCFFNWKNKKNDQEEKKNDQEEKVLWSNFEEDQKELEGDMIEAILDTGCNKSVVGDI
jgi:hypothetical protein